MGRIVFINATAAKSGGALTILNNFIENVPNFNKEFSYFFFVHKNFETNSKNSNITFVKINTVAWSKRILWDNFGLKKWIKKNKIYPNLVISLQNTGVNLPEIPQIIYYHQLIPLEKYKWNFFKSGERILFLYKHIYPFFVQKYLKVNTKIIVQQNFIKKAFKEKFKIKSDNIIVIKPKIKVNDTRIKKIELEYGYFHFFYPAIAAKYKNHLEIVNAVIRINQENQDLANKIRIHFTCYKNEKNKFVKLINEQSLENNFIFHGQISYNETLSMYKSVDALLFPSYIETFGLPLVEAASFGLPIIASDLPYSREVLENYGGVKFAELFNCNNWAKLMMEIIKEKTKFDKLLYKNENKLDFSDLIESVLNKDYV